MAEPCPMACTQCRKAGRSGQLQWYQINFDTAVLLCNNNMCTYPLDSPSETIPEKKRHFSKMPIPAKRRKITSHNDPSSIASNPLHLSKSQKHSKKKSPIIDTSMENMFADQDLDLMHLLGENTSVIKGVSGEDCCISTTSNSCFDGFLPDALAEILDTDFQDWEKSLTNDKQLPHFDKGVETESKLNTPIRHTECNDAQPTHSAHAIVDDLAIEYRETGNQFSFHSAALFIPEPGGDSHLSSSSNPPRANSSPTTRTDVVNLTTLSEDLSVHDDSLVSSGSTEGNLESCAALPGDPSDSGPMNQGPMHVNNLMLPCVTHMIDIANEKVTPKVQNAYILESSKKIAPLGDSANHNSKFVYDITSPVQNGSVITSAKPATTSQECVVPSPSTLSTIGKVLSNAISGVSEVECGLLPDIVPSSYNMSQHGNYDFGRSMVELPQHQDICSSVPHSLIAPSSSSAAPAFPEASQIISIPEHLNTAGIPDITECTLGDEAVTITSVNTILSPHTSSECKSVTKNVSCPGKHPAQPVFVNDTVPSDTCAQKIVVTLSSTASNAGTLDACPMQGGQTSFLARVLQALAKRKTVHTSSSTPTNQSSYKIALALPSNVYNKNLLGSASPTKYTFAILPSKSSTTLTSGVPNRIHGTISTSSGSVASANSHLSCTPTVPVSKQSEAMDNQSVLMKTLLSDVSTVSCSTQAEKVTSGFWSTSISTPTLSYSNTTNSIKTRSLTVASSAAPSTSIANLPSIDQSVSSITLEPLMRSKASHNCIQRSKSSPPNKALKLASQHSSLSMINKYFAQKVSCKTPLKNSNDSLLSLTISDKINKATFTSTKALKKCAPKVSTPVTSLEKEDSSSQNADFHLSKPSNGSLFNLLDTKFSGKSSFQTNVSLPSSTCLKAEQKARLLLPKPSTSTTGKANKSGKIGEKCQSSAASSTMPHKIRHRQTNAVVEKAVESIRSDGELTITTSRDSVDSEVQETSSLSTKNGDVRMLGGMISKIKDMLRAKGRATGFEGYKPKNHNHNRTDAAHPVQRASTTLKSQKTNRRAGHRRGRRGFQRNASVRECPNTVENLTVQNDDEVNSSLDDLDKILNQLDQNSKLSHHDESDDWLLELTS